MPENLYGQGVGRRGRQRAVAPGHPGQAGPSQQATANGGEEALIEVGSSGRLYIEWLFYDYILLKIKMIEAATLFNFLFLVVILIIMQ
jgi:hypothetical protein